MTAGQTIDGDDQGTIHGRAGLKFLQAHHRRVAIVHERIALESHCRACPRQRSVHDKDFGRARTSAIKAKMSHILATAAGAAKLQLGRDR
jgi:hypothetical protein